MKCSNGFIESLYISLVIYFNPWILIIIIRVSITVYYITKQTTYIITSEVFPSSWINVPGKNTIKIDMELKLNKNI